MVLPYCFFLLLISLYLYLYFLLSFFSLFPLFFLFFLIFFPPLPTVEIVAQDYAGTLCGKVRL